MSIIPKVYRFTIYYWRLRNGEYELSSQGTAYNVATNETNAIKAIEKYQRRFHSKHTMLILEESWLANIAVLLLPRYSYTSKHKWRSTEL